MGTGILLLLIGGLFAGGGARPAPVVEKKKLIPKDKEPDYKPGPIDVKPVVPPDVEDDQAWLDSVDDLITPQPTPGRFYQIQPGDTMSALAGMALGGANNGSNRVAYIKCMTRTPWNYTFYVTSRYAASWGTMFDVDGENLSAAFFPRQASAPQALARREMPERTINDEGIYIGGQTGYFAMLWFPEFTAGESGIICDPGNPPDWLLSALNGAAGSDVGAPRAVRSVARVASATARVASPRGTFTRAMGERLEKARTLVQQAGVAPRGCIFVPSTKEHEAYICCNSESEGVWLCVKISGGPSIPDDDLPPPVRRKVALGKG